MIERQSCIICWYWLYYKIKIDECKDDKEEE